MSEIFLDTNILLYALDPKSPKKQSVSRGLLRKETSAVISTQVLQEFYVAGVKKMGVDPGELKNLVHLFSENLTTVLVDPSLIKEAIDISMVTKFSFWEALIIASAERAKCSLLYSEDMRHGQTVRGIRIVNPFI